MKIGLFCIRKDDKWVMGSTLLRSLLILSNNCYFEFNNLCRSMYIAAYDV
jgi:hypothetical protein